MASHSENGATPDEPALETGAELPGWPSDNGPIPVLATQANYHPQQWESRHCRRTWYLDDEGDFWMWTFTVGSLDAFAADSLGHLLANGFTAEIHPRNTDYGIELNVEICERCAA